MFYSEPCIWRRLKKKQNSESWLQDLHHRRLHDFGRRTEEILLMNKSEQERTEESKERGEPSTLISVMKVKKDWVTKRGFGRWVE